MIPKTLRNIVTSGKKLVLDKHYRNLHLFRRKLGKRARFQECIVSIDGIQFMIPDSASFLSSYRDIFVNNSYAFTSEKRNPKILDIGANIGLSILYFKQLFPDAEITALEADPKIFHYLTTNINNANLQKVKLINKAAWIKNTKLSFFSEGADAGFVSNNNHGCVEVDAIDLREYLRSNRYDLIKMDIEGSENTVIPACKDVLSNSLRIFVEYHSRVGEKQQLDKVICALSDSGFRIHLYPVLYTSTPFLGVNTINNYDLQLNIYGWRE